MVQMKDCFRVTVLKDCLAYVDAQGHKAALAAMKEEGIKITKTNQI